MIATVLIDCFYGLTNELLLFFFSFFGKNNYGDLSDDGFKISFW